MLRTVLALAALLAAAPALAAEPSPALQQVIAAAQKEGRLDLQFGGGTLGDSRQLGAMVAAMNKMFGTAIALRFTPGPSEPEMVDKIVVALRAGLPSPTDAQIAADQYGAEMYTEKASQPVDWTALLPSRIEPQSIEAGGTAIRIYTVLPGGIVYNTKLAPEVPQRLTDLLKPEWKGRIATTPYASQFELLTSSDVWGLDRALDFARKLSAQAAGLIRCNELERVASGEFIAFGPNCGDREYLRYKAAGAPIDQALPKDFAPQRFYYATVPKNSAHPDVAKLFIAFLETPEGQRTLWQANDEDLSTYPDSQFAKEIAADEKSGVTFRQFPLEWFLKHPDSQAGAAKAVLILRGHS